MSPLTGDRELEAILPPAGVCREPEFTRGVDREAVLGSAGGLLTLPFGIAQGTKLRPVIHSGSFIGIEVPVWDIADNFGDTNLLVTNMAQASDLAKYLGGSSVALMRGHGFAGPQPGLQPLFGRDLAHLRILGEQGRLRPPADPARRHAHPPKG